MPDPETRNSLPGTTDGSEFFESLTFCHEYIKAQVIAYDDLHAENVRLREELDYDPEDPNWGEGDRTRRQLRRIIRRQHKTHKAMYATIKLLTERLEAASAR